MKYLTGLVAFGVPCELNSIGKWNVTKDEFTNPDKFTIAESDDSPFKDYGIEKDKIVRYHPDELYNVANHVRAYLDLLADRNFNVLKDLFYECIKDTKCRELIFKAAYGKLRYLACFHDVNNFMIDEFGNAWVSYVDSVEQINQNINDAEESVRQHEEAQKDIKHSWSPLYDELIDKEDVKNLLSMADDRLNEIVLSCILLDCKNVDLDRVNDVLDNNDINVTIYDKTYIENVYRAFKFMTETIGKPIDITFLYDLSAKISNELSYDAGQLRADDIPTANSIPCESLIIGDMKEINDTDNALSKAMTYIGYIYKNALFSHGNIAIACLIANKILIEAGEGLFIIPSTHRDVFTKELNEFMKSGDATGLYTFIVNHCIVKIGD